MMAQPDLFSQPPPFVAGSRTSFGAAEQIKPTARNLRERVYAYIAEHGPCTDEEIAEGLEMNPSTARPRRLELAKEGRILLGSAPQLTRAGRKAVTWKVAPENHQGF
jgi:predicted ArsR family transcriptional regulator